MFGKKTEANSFCPLVRGECVGEACKFWVHIRGEHPQTGAEIDMPDCAVRWIPTLLIENSQQVRQHAASVDKVATETAKSGASISGAVMQFTREIREAKELAATERKQLQQEKPLN